MWQKSIFSKGRIFGRAVVALLFLTIALYSIPVMAMEQVRDWWDDIVNPDPEPEPEPEPEPDPQPAEPLDDEAITGYYYDPDIGRVIPRYGDLSPAESESAGGN